ncbi:MAG: biosynthetic peptidoglycan transglycosylase [Bdellovibrionota bacterium]
MDQRKTLWRKVKEFFWAREIERQLTKNEILAFYLNMVEWGPGLYGIGKAAPYYFGISASELSPKQAAFLAMLLPSPVKYHNRYFVRREITDWAAVRIARTLRVMYRMSFIDRETYGVAVASSLFGESVTPLPEDWIDSEDELTPPSDVAESPAIETPKTEDTAISETESESATAATENTPRKPHHRGRNRHLHKLRPH